MHDNETSFTCNLQNILSSYSFPQSYDLPNLKSKIPQLDVICLSSLPLTFFYLPLLGLFIGHPQHTSLKGSLQRLSAFIVNICNQQFIIIIIIIIIIITIIIIIIIIIIIFITIIIQGLLPSPSWTQQDAARLCRSETVVEVILPTSLWSLSVSRTLPWCSLCCPYCPSLFVKP